MSHPNAELEDLIERYLDLLNGNIPTQEFNKINRKIADTLFRGFLIYDVLSFLYPDHTCESTVIYIYDLYSYSDKSANIFPSRYYSKWFGFSRGRGARISLRSLDILRNCIAEAEKTHNSIAIELKYGEETSFHHSAILWIDTQNKIINLYDPGFDIEDIRLVDSTLKQFFAESLPGYDYIGNTVEPQQCIQNIIMTERGYADSFCVYYSWLYAIYRMKGYSHEQAINYLLENRQSLRKEIANLIREMVNISHRYTS